MVPRLLVIIASDPRSSLRPAEALRIAAGVSAWKAVEVAVYLRGPAVLALDPFHFDLLDEGKFSDCLPLITQQAGVLYAEAGSDFLPELKEPLVHFDTIDDSGLARLAAGCRATLRF